MNWEKLRKIINEMTNEELEQPIVLFDYRTGEFTELDVCLEGEPPVHFTVN